MTVLLAGALAAAACTSGGKTEGEAAPAAQPAGKPVTEAPPPVPVVTPAGKPLRVAAGDVGDRSFEVTIPDGFKSEIADDGETTPILILTGPDFDVWFQSPLGLGDPGETDSMEGAAAHTYEVRVARPDLDVVCFAQILDNRAEADAAAAVCGTLRP